MRRKLNIGFSNLPSLTSLLRGNFLSGLLILIPFAVTAWIIGRFLGFLRGMLAVLPVTWQPAAYLSDPGLVLLVDFVMMIALFSILTIAISWVGWVSKQFIGQKVLDFLADLIQKIPVLRTIYSSLDQLIKAFNSGSGKQQFSRVVYFEYPRKGAWVLAFVTGPAPNPSGNAEGAVRYLNIFVPTTPNPTSGFHLIVPESEVRDSGLKVEDAFRTLISLGIVQNTSPVAAISNPRNS